MTDFNTEPAPLTPSTQTQWGRDLGNLVAQAVAASPRERAREASRLEAEEVKEAMRPYLQDVFGPRE